MLQVQPQARTSDTVGLCYRSSHKPGQVTQQVYVTGLATSQENRPQQMGRVLPTAPRAKDLSGGCQCSLSTLFIPVFTLLCLAQCSPSVYVSVHLLLFISVLTSHFVYTSVHFFLFMSVFTFCLCQCSPSSVYISLHFPFCLYQCSPPFVISVFTFCLCQCSPSFV